MSSKESVTAARKAADDAKKANKGKENPTLEAALATEMANVRADHAARNVDAPFWAKNR